MKSVLRILLWLSVWDVFKCLGCMCLGCMYVSGMHVRVWDVCTCLGCIYVFGIYVSVWDPITHLRGNNYLYFYARA
jgi:hypothetical protein